MYARLIRRDRPFVGDKWHLDEMVTSIRGKKHWLWRAVGPHGNSLDILVQSRRNAKAANRLMRKLMKQFGMPDQILLLSGTTLLVKLPPAKPVCLGKLKLGLLT
ncbi:Mobile element protein [hydrothermal vent metagenome]|uniref:Mobile element protein n=1 Tax=hydrothermal vent metagenome TaxID=652676 RepID=A0A3B0S870_9ZZZZ